METNFSPSLREVDRKEGGKKNKQIESGKVEESTESAGWNEIRLKLGAFVLSVRSYVQ